jgi:hypothetical protein
LPARFFAAGFFGADFFAIAFPGAALATGAFLAGFPATVVLEAAGAFDRAAFLATAFFGAALIAGAFFATAFFAGFGLGLGVAFATDGLVLALALLRAARVFAASAAFCRLTIPQWSKLNKVSIFGIPPRISPLFHISRFGAESE